MKNLFCPISSERINEQVPRITAMLVIVMVIVAFALDSLIAMAFVAADFFIRGFTKMKFSPLSFVAYWITQVLNLPARPIDKAPKIFAARMGFVMSLAFAVLFAAQIGTASAVIAGILVFFAGLEFAFAFCAGCSIYSYLVLPFYKN
ncbi:DUF4395 domain-containing protein [uncultured Sunxiuqinia sp.]|uniref:DUF4395 domain-containing protein n=1 Tax=uncultured Sunxiuqinia sp. TaxID=1573825 RepID=UPI0019A9E714|nr:DUF4395 domain-containing protein [Sunxiuqinia sp.]|tara:strand:- start:588 stop:1028 length:441 start_codon:yes stop_codon:yes gene_type:complete